MNEQDEVYITKSKLKPYFKADCHTGFLPNQDKNFYSVYDELFKRLDREEYMEEQVGVKHRDAPPFGTHYSCADDVFAFYEGWRFFSTQKKFTYADLYNPNEAPNRRVKRLIEAENKKERNKERAEFNEKVRELVEMLKDKDPRYKKFARIR